MSDAADLGPTGGIVWSMPMEWQRRRSRSGCVICTSAQPLDVIAELPSCWVTAQRAAPLPGYVCVVAKQHVVEPFEMSPDDQCHYWHDAMLVARAVADLVRPIKMNYEIHGNTLPHLHLHLFPRHADDPFVGGPIDPRTSVVERSSAEIEALASAVRQAGGRASVRATGSGERDATWGQLLDGGEAPTDGERAVELARGRGFTVEQILSGQLGHAVDYRQDHDEWVVVVEGGAALEVDGVEHELTRGDWVLLPANVAHRLVSTEPGTSWVAVRSTGSPPARP